MPAGQGEFEFTLPDTSLHMRTIRQWISNRLPHNILLVLVIGMLPDVIRQHGFWHIPDFHCKLEMRL